MNYIEQNLGSVTSYSYGTAASPRTHAEKDVRVVPTRWFDRMDAVLAIAASVCIVLGVSVQDLHFWKRIPDTGKHGQFLSLGWNVTPFGWFALSSAILAFLMFAVRMFLRTDVIPLGMGWVLRSGDRFVRLTKPTGACPKCPGQLGLARVVTNTKQVRQQDGSFKDAHVHERRLVCSMNPRQHQFEFDYVLIDT